MTRQAAVKRIERKLRELNGTRIDYRQASEILRVVEQCYLPLRNEWDLAKGKKK